MRVVALAGCVIVVAACAGRGRQPRPPPAGSRGAGAAEPDINELIIGKLLDGLDAAPRLSPAGDKVVRCATEGTGRRQDPFEVWCHVASVGDGAAHKWTVLTRGQASQLDYAANAPSAKAREARNHLDAAAVEVTKILGPTSRSLAPNCKTDGSASANCAFGTEIVITPDGALIVRLGAKVILSTAFPPRSRERGAPACEDDLHVESWADGPSRVLAIAIHRYNKVPGCDQASTSELRAVSVP